MLSWTEMSAYASTADLSHTQAFSHRLRYRPSHMSKSSSILRGKRVYPQEPPDLYLDNQWPLKVGFKNERSISNAPIVPHQAAQKRFGQVCRKHNSKAQPFFQPHCNPSSEFKLLFVNWRLCLHVKSGTAYQPTSIRWPSEALVNKWTNLGLWWMSRLA